MVQLALLLAPLANILTPLAMHANALQLSTGTETHVSHVSMAELGTQLQKHANVLNLCNGMDTLAPRLTPVTMAKSGMSIPTVVNAPKLPIGMELNVLFSHNAKVVKLLIATINAAALLVSYGLKIHAFILHALVAKFGLAPNVSAQLVLISMELCALNASMVKNGTSPRKLALANQDINGMVNIAKSHTHAQLAEFGTQPINNASALMDSTGQDITV